MLDLLSQSDFAVNLSFFHMVCISFMALGAIQALGLYLLVRLDRRVKSLESSQGQSDPGSHKQN